MSHDLRPGIDRPFTLLIAALGGEGGGLLTDWIVEASTNAGMFIQATSIPGLAQRTGATTYYLEIMAPVDGTDEEPLFGLYPAPGYVDMAVASELMEAGRLVENGFVSPQRTTLIASTHRVFTIAERTAMGDGAFATPKLIDAARAFAKSHVLRDFATTTHATGTALNALLLGAMSAHPDFPVPLAELEAAIGDRKVAVEANLKGLATGRALALEDASSSVPTEAVATPQKNETLNRFPDAVRDIIEAGTTRLTDYQNTAYAELFASRMASVRDALDGADDDHTTLRETGRYLALWMAYEDVIRVADLKSRASRHDRVRKETAAGAAEPVRVREFFKPGVDEFSTILPAFLARRLIAWSERRGNRDSFNIPLHVRSDTITGHVLLRFVASLKRKRHRTPRFGEEQALIERWLAALISAVPVSSDLAREIALCGRLIKGYGDTRRRAHANFTTLLDAIVDPALDGRLAAADAYRRLAAARGAALADEEGHALRATLAAQASNDDAGAAPAQAAE
jgi:indolepyruvate ferredoxin oxidoreductase beta subunit